MDSNKSSNVMLDSPSWGDAPPVEVEKVEGCAIGSCKWCQYADCIYAENRYKDCIYTGVTAEKVNLKCCICGEELEGKHTYEIKDKDGKLILGNPKAVCDNPNCLTKSGLVGHCFTCKTPLYKYFKFETQNWEHIQEPSSSIECQFCHLDTVPNIDNTIDKLKKDAAHTLNGVGLYTRKVEEASIEFINIVSEDVEYVQQCHDKENEELKAKRIEMYKKFGEELPE